MAEQIVSADINQYGMIVDSEGRAHVHAHSEDYRNHRGELGFAFNVNSGSVTLTDASTETGVLYIKNNETQTMVIHKLVYIVGNSTSGTGNMTIRVVRNPTTGTLISGATPAAIISNRNYGSANTLEASNIYVGANAETITDGTDNIYTIYNSAAFRSTIDVGDIILPKGSSIAVGVTTQASNSSMAVAIAAEVYLRPSDANS